jgi:hypothetical protein
MRDSVCNLGQRREAWWRGPAVIEGDWITIDRRKTEEYHPTLFADLRPGENPLAELAVVRRPRDAVAFARSFGLLYPPLDDGPWRESFRVWEQQAQLLRLGLTLYADVQATMADRTPERIRALREWSGRDCRTSASTTFATPPRRSCWRRASRLRTSRTCSATARSC